MNDLEKIEDGLLLMDKLFGEGSSTVAYCGRNDAIVKTALETLPANPKHILVLGSGPYELWTIAGHRQVVDGNATILGIDRSDQITSINQQIKDGGEVKLSSVYSIIGNPVFGQEKHPKTSKQLLDESEVSGVAVDGEQIRVDKINRDRVQIASPSDAADFVSSQEDGSFSFIFSGNLENNMLFQPGYSRERGVTFHRDIARLLEEKGIYAYTTNEVFFNDTNPASARNVREILQEAGLDILYKATQYTHVLQKNGQVAVTENCGIISAKSNEYGSLPHYERAINTVKQRLDSYKDSFQYIENEGTLKELQEAIASGQTNVAMVKVAPDKYHWFNIQGGYREVIPKLAKIGEGFYPDLF